LKQLKFLKSETHKIPCMSKTDKVMKYIRYADDFIIGVKGNKEDCEYMKKQFSEFISQTLKMELSEEKTLITHSSQHARFLGYDIRVRRNDAVKPNGNHLSRTLNNKVELNIPITDKIMTFLYKKLIIRQTQEGTIEPIARRSLYRCTDLEIVDTYNSELRGICNYYAIASNFVSLNYFSYIMEHSCLKTLAGKYDSTSMKILDLYRIDNNSWGIPYETKEGLKYCRFAKYMDCKNANSFSDIITKHSLIHETARNTFEKRLSARECELCGKTNVPLEIHHINKVKNLKGKQTWEIVMITKKRKTLVVCKNCHYKIHHP